MSSLSHRHDGAPVMMLKSAARDALDQLKKELYDSARRRRITSEQAKLAYLDAVQQTISNPNALVEATNHDPVVKCRSCARTVQIPAQEQRGEVGVWNCICSPSEKRFMFIDEWEPDKGYIIDQHAIVNKPKDTSIDRARDIAAGASVEEITEIYGG